MHSNRESGQRRVPTELSEIGRIEGSMTELTGIGRSKALLQSSSGSVVSSSYDRSHGDWFKDASITDLAAVGVTPISDEVALALLDPGAGRAGLDEEKAPL
ncbi:uncharacterized protein UHOD_12173 [Ustilago sp. UG-2017b]|nr:uncharacterized protein UHOD_12173 [Ustilago sp. UG-2017b]